jgi:peptide chain release factor
MIWLHGTIGRGPEECQIALKGVLGHLLEEANDAGLAHQILEYSETKHGATSFLVAIEGAGEEEFAKTWNGTMQWICKSKIRPEHKRKRWFVSIGMIKAPRPDEAISDTDLVWETMKASGPGGQHMNKTESAVRLTHKPSGIVVTAQEERSQYRNKSLALAKLHARMAEIKKDGEKNTSKERWDDHNSLERGNAVRTFEGENFKKGAALLAKAITL